MYFTDEIHFHICILDLSSQFISHRFGTILQNWLNIAGIKKKLFFGFKLGNSASQNREIGNVHGLSRYMLKKSCKDSTIELLRRVATVL